MPTGVVHRWSGLRRPTSCSRDLDPPYMLQADMIDTNMPTYGRPHDGMPRGAQFFGLRTLPITNWNAARLSA